MTAVNISPDYGTAAYVRRARTPHRCQSDLCSRTILAGDLYVRSVCFPGHDANSGKRPYGHKLCAKCALPYRYPIEPDWSQCIRDGLL